MGEIIKNYFLAMEKYGRPKGPFEPGREYPYRATATAKPGPPVDPRHQEPPPDEPPEWWDL